MNRNGRIVGGILVTLAVLWILRIAGALPFSNRSTNQAAAQTPTDRPPITNFDASRSTTAGLNPPTTTQPFLPGENTTGGNTGGDGSSIADSTQPGTSTGADTTPTTRPIGVPTTPVVRAGW